MSLESILIAIFWLLLAVWPVVYVIYPIGLLGIARLRRAPPAVIDRPWPTLAILVAAHNEEATIERCVRSCLAQAYPGVPPLVVIGLDGCTDGTADVLGRIEDPRLKVIAFERQGKAATDNALISGCDAEVVAMTSAGAEYAPGALEKLVRPLRSSRVGCTGGVFAPRRTGATTAAAEATYFALEYRLMSAESKLGILAKASGTALAFRRSLWQPIPTSSDADVTLPYLAVRRGARVEFVPGAVVFDDGPQNLKTVFRARRRMATQAIVNISSQVADLARAGYWGPAASLTLHKLLRWLAPSILIVAAFDGLLLGALGEWTCALLLLVIVAGALICLSAVSILRGTRLSVASGFFVSQVAFAAATLDCLRGSRATRWER